MSYEAPLTRRESVLAHLRQEIVSGALPAGSVIKDGEVARRLGMSITPVREALTQLAAEGLVDISPNRTRRVTAIDQKSALELTDVMSVLTQAGFEWGVVNLGAAHLEDLRSHLNEFVACLDRGDTTAAAAAGAAFTTTVITASGNRELQTHVDLVVTRSLRLLALSPGSDIWEVWIAGYREVLSLLEGGDRTGAVERYARIYVDYRERVEALVFDQPSVEQ